MTALKTLRIGALVYCCAGLTAGRGKPAFSVIAFYTGKEDPAHISFLHEVERWFPETAAKYHFSYDATSDWHNLNPDFLAQYQVVVFLDTRPEDPAQRSETESRYRHSAFDRLVELSAGHRPQAARDLAQWLLSRGLVEQEVQDDLSEHGPQRHRL